MVIYITSRFLSNKEAPAFDNVDRTALWQLLLSVGLPHRTVELFKALYTDTVSCVRADGCESEWFPVNSSSSSSSSSSRNEYY